MIRNVSLFEKKELINNLKLRLALPMYLQNRSRKNYILQRYLTLYAQFENVNKLRNVVKAYTGDNRTDISINTSSSVNIPTYIVRYWQYLDQLDESDLNSNDDTLKTIEDFKLEEEGDNKV